MTRDTAFTDAVSATARNVFVIAPPGCGKTELLARRAEKLIPALAPGQKILALTFSNKAKANLSSRLTSVLGTERKRRFVTVHNFHGHAAEIIRSHGRTLGLDATFEMPNKRTQTDVVAPFLDGLADKDTADLRNRIDDDLRVAKQGPYDDAQVMTVLLARGIAQSQAIEAARQADGQLHFDDLLRHAQRLIRLPQIADLFRAHYGAILIDEFQDLSPQQLDLALRSCDRSRTFVGDPLQGIYSWTGARPAEVEKRLRKISGAPLGLGVSYRSSPKVLAVLNLVSVSLGGQEIEPDNPTSWVDGGAAVGRAFNTGGEEADFIEKTASQIMAKQPSATIGIISRSAWRRKPIDAAFATSKLSSTRWDLAVDNPQIIELIGDAISRLGGNSDIAALKGDLLTRIGSSDVDTMADVVDALEQLEQLAAQAGSVEAALAQLRVLEEGDVAIGPGVHLLNAHIGKGQQFDWVFIPGFEDGHIPSFLAKGEAELEEEHRVLLVMLSRARHGIIISRAGSLISKKGSPYQTTLSRWTKELHAGMVTGASELQSHIANLAAS